MKRTISIILSAVLLLSVAFCCSLTVVAVGEKITVISTKSGTLYDGETKSFRFEIPAEAKLVISFTDETYGYVLIRIKDSNGDWVYIKEKYIAYEEERISVTLPADSYKLYLTENDEWDFDYEFKAVATLLEDVHAETVSLSKKSVSLSVGKSLTLTESHTPSFVSDESVWSSSNSKVVAVDSNGNVKAKALGKATITFKLGTKTAKCVVNVVSDNNYVQVLVGKTVSVKNRFSNISGYSKAKYVSSEKKIATVSSSGVVTGKATGKVKITATIKGEKYVQKVQVKKPSIELNKTAATIYKGAISAVSGSSVTLKAKTYPEDRKITWTSSNTRVAKVSEGGKVIAVAPGTATITASFKCAGITYSKSCKITVKSKAVVSANVTKVYEDDIYNDCYIDFKNNTNKDITYITLNIYQYDNRGYRISSPYDYYYYNETIKANSTEKDVCFWVNDDTKSAKAIITKVWFRDGSTYTP